MTQESGKIICSLLAFSPVYKQHIFMYEECTNHDRENIKSLLYVKCSWWYKILIECNLYIKYYTQSNCVIRINIISVVTQGIVVFLFGLRFALSDIQTFILINNVKDW